MNWVAWIDFIKQHAGVLGLSLTWAGLAWVYYRSRVDWGQKRFGEIVNFSLNYLDGDTLVMRTLIEEEADDVWLNRIGVQKLLAAARRTTIERPFVILDRQIDMDFAYRAALNVLSERFAGAFVAQALGAAVHSGEFLFAITYERYKEMRTFKLRVLLVERRTLETRFGPDALEKIRLSHPVYGPRRQTLMRMHELHLQSMSGGKHALGSVELAVAKTA
jgi:hypothetical protein